AFNGMAGERYYYDGMPDAGFNYHPLARLYAPLGNIVMSGPSHADIDTFTLPQSGLYLLAIEGLAVETRASGSFAFNLVPNPPQPVTSLLVGNGATFLVLNTNDNGPGSFHQAILDANA